MNKLFFLEVINCFPDYSLYFRGLNGSELFLFTFISLILVSGLLWYYSKIPKNKTLISELDTPIYQSKDILLQENNLQGNDFPIEKTTSVWAKLLVYTLIIIVATTPLFELFGIDSFY